MTATITTTCAPVHVTKNGGAYTTDEGQHVPAHTLHKFNCACGERKHCGIAWYASQDRAWSRYARNLDGIECPQCDGHGEVTLADGTIDVCHHCAGHGWRNPVNPSRD